MFVTTFTGSMDLAGLPASMQLVLTSVGQIIVGSFLPRFKYLDGFAHKIYSTRFALLLIPVMLFLRLNPHLVVTLFIIIFGFFSFMDGFTIVPWTDIYTRTIPPEKRGRLLETGLHSVELLVLQVVHL
ncbi:MAG TPA: hypothetical protein GXZ50_07425 [Clostridia bacterium]|nr:hypothetical protein [Clostridia bacterium]